MGCASICRARGGPTRCRTFISESVKVRQVKMASFLCLADRSRTSSTPPLGPAQRRLKVSLRAGVALECGRVDGGGVTTTACFQCPTSTTWSWMKTTQGPGGCRTSGGETKVISPFGNRGLAMSDFAIGGVNLHSSMTSVMFLNGALKKNLPFCFRN